MCWLLAPVALRQGLNSWNGALLVGSLLKPLIMQPYLRSLFPGCFTVWPTQSKSVGIFYTAVSQEVFCFDLVFMWVFQSILRFLGVEACNRGQNRPKKCRNFLHFSGVGPSSKRATLITD